MYQNNQKTQSNECLICFEPLLKEISLDILHFGTSVNYFAENSPQNIKKYSDYVIVVAPSSQEDNLVRGFAPMEMIAKTTHQNVFTGLYKKEKYKQSDLRYQDRKKMKEKIGIKNGKQLKGKKILILDDSTSALDYLTDRYVRDNLQKLSHHPAILLISQRANSLMNADQIIVIDNGNVVGIGTHSQLLQSCFIYQEIYQSQQKSEVK